MVGYNDDGRPRKRIQEVYKETSCAKFIDYLIPKLQKIVSHIFVARWQDVHYRIRMDTLPSNFILSRVDFVENYTFENKSMYWHSVQITILVHISCRVDPATVKVVKETHFYISNDKTHGTLFVQHCFLKHWECLQSMGVTPTRHAVWSDGCASQFKGATSIYFVSRYPALTGGCGMTWNYFGTSQGKGKCDGGGAVI